MDRNSEPMAAGDRRRVLAGPALNAAAGLWWADPLAALVIVFYAFREAREIFLPGPLASRSVAKAPEAS